MSAAKTLRPPLKSADDIQVTNQPPAALPDNPSNTPSNSTREEEIGVMELTLSDVHTLSRLLAFNIESPADLISRVRRMSVMSVDGVEIRIEDGLVSRLKSRALSQWGPEWMRKTVTDLLHGYVGW